MLLPILSLQGRSNIPQSLQYMLVFKIYLFDHILLSSRWIVNEIKLWSSPTTTHNRVKSTLSHVSRGVTTVWVYSNTWSVVIVSAYNWSRVLGWGVVSRLTHWTCMHNSNNSIKNSLILALDLNITHIFDIWCFIVTSLVGISSEWWLSVDNSSCSCNLVLVAFKVLVDPIKSNGMLLH